MKVQIHQLKLKCDNEECEANKDNVCMNTFTALEDLEVVPNLDSCYEKVYNMEITEDEFSNKDNILEHLFHELNINHPKDYTGRSLSVSDIIQLGDEYYYCQPVGFMKVEME